MQFACGGESPTSATDAATSAVPATSTSSTSSAPPAGANVSSGFCANGQALVATFDIKVFTVLVDDGQATRPWDGGPIYVGEVIRFDSQGHDRFRQRTNGCGDGPRWDWGPEELVRWSGDFGWNPRATVLKAGSFWVDASMDGVPADFKLLLNFVDR
jgi:hypothetical protein